jgi:hypothetical protein
MEAILLLGVIVVALMIFDALSVNRGVDSRDTIGDDHAWSTAGRR